MYLIADEPTRLVGVTSFLAFPSNVVAEVSIRLRFSYPSGSFG